MRRGRRVVIKKLLIWVAIAFVAFYLVTQPTGAADAVKGAASGVESAFGSIITFFSSLFS
jgi:hypothetical protein